MPTQNDFSPDWASPPGETITDILAEMNLSVRDFAGKMRCTAKTATDLFYGRIAITTETAEQLARVLGASATFWMTREAQYREDLKRIQGGQKGSDEDKWLTDLPVRDMVKFGWIKAVQKAELKDECLHFFGVQTAEAWRDKYDEVLELAVFRTSPTFASQAASVAAWLRRGELESALVNCQPWSLERFKGILPTVRNLTRTADPKLFIPTLVKECASCGVAVVITPAPAGCRASGATQFISPEKALLMLSFRYLSDDHFWFTFFHEAGHLITHSPSLFLEGSDLPSSEAEAEANQFAANVLIPPQFENALLKLPVDGRQVMQFARQIGVSPGIVVGQLQHRGHFTRRQLNNLKRRFRWTAI